MSEHFDIDKAIAFAESWFGAPCPELYPLSAAQRLMSAEIDREVRRLRSRAITVAPHTRELPE